MVIYAQKLQLSTYCITLEGGSIFLFIGEYSIALWLETYSSLTNLITNSFLNINNKWTWYPVDLYRLADWSMDHYSDVIMGTIASQITSLTIVYSTVYSDVDQRKHQSSASLAFVRGIHRGPVNSPHKWPVTRKMFPLDDVIVEIELFIVL